MATPSPSQKPVFSLPKLVANLAYHAMNVEVYLTPKPGLVDKRNNGAHHDMNLALFLTSADAIAPYMERFVVAGRASAKQNVSQLLRQLRPIGQEAERVMFRATKGVNTHKGMIFNLGLICGAVGWLEAKHLKVDALHIKEVIRQSCEGLVYDELKARVELPAATAGERIYQQYGLCGARGEAASGMATVMNYALPTYQHCLQAGRSEEESLLRTLLVIMTQNDDTNVVSRGGIEELRFLQNYAAQILENIAIRDHTLEAELIKFDDELIARNLSPGGAADLLSATWLIHEIVQLFANK